MRTRNGFVLSLVLVCGIGLSQENQTSVEQDSVTPKLILDWMLVDVPYAKYSAQARANYRTGSIIDNSASIQFKDYISIIEGPSMNQVISYTTDFYNAMNFGIAKGWNKMVDPYASKRKRIFNAIGSELSAAVAFVATTKVPFAGGWAHEEFHRNTWAVHGIGSYNGIWEFDLAPDALTYVGEMYDDNLALMKERDPAGFVRMGSAGIEAHYLVSERIQTQDFLFNTNLPNLALYWANFLAAADYVNRAHTTKTIEEHSATYLNQPDQLKRDFTGNDFTAWAYDLFNPDELYADRGEHPTGFGIDRYRDYNDLTQGMLSYLERIGNRQWLNAISPFMFRIREIKLGENLGFNFALRHYLTSFGDDIKLDLFFNYKGRKTVVSLHKYSNHDTEWFPGIDLTSYLTFVKFKNGSSLQGSGRLAGWIQPEEQAFFTDRGQLGGMLALKAAYQNKTRFEPYFEVETKSAGWVAGSPYLTQKNSLRFGIQTCF